MKALIETDLLQEEGILPVDGLQAPSAASNLPWVSSLSAYPAEIELASRHRCMNQFLKISFSLSVGYILSYWFCFSGEAWRQHYYTFSLGRLED